MDPWYYVPAYNHPDALSNISESGAYRTRFVIDSNPWCRGLQEASQVYVRICTDLVSSML